MLTGRFAPSPTGPLHLGNLRTALVSWLQARSVGGRWLVRMEDLDRTTASLAHERAQLSALATLGMRPDGEVVRQSDRFMLHRRAIDRLREADRVYECFCTRREIREAVTAPHGTHLPYPGTCRDLDPAGRASLLAAGRRPALRLRAESAEIVVHDLLAGRYVGTVDDVVLQRNDGIPAYNLAVVVDDAAQGVTHVTRGDDLLGSTPRQVLLQQLLDLPTPTYAHIPLVVGPDGERLAKRHGAVTLDELVARGTTAETVVALLGESLGLCRRDAHLTIDDLADNFRIADVPPGRWRVPDELL